MAIKVAGTTVIDDSRNACNLQTVCATTYYGCGANLTGISGTATGEVGYFPLAASTPSGYIPADGSIYSCGDYPSLYNCLKYSSFGDTDWSIGNNFNFYELDIAVALNCLHVCACCKAQTCRYFWNGTCGTNVDTLPGVNISVWGFTCFYSKQNIENRSRCDGAMPNWCQNTTAATSKPRSSNPRFYSSGSTDGRFCQTNYFGPGAGVTGRHLHNGTYMLPIGLSYIPCMTCTGFFAPGFSWDYLGSKYNSYYWFNITDYEFSVNGNHRLLQPPCSQHYNLNNNPGTFSVQFSIGGKCGIQQTCCCDEATCYDYSFRPGLENSAVFCQFFVQHSQCRCQCGVRFVLVDSNFPDPTCGCSLCFMLGCGAGDFNHCCCIRGWLFCGSGSQACFIYSSSSPRANFLCNVVACNSTCPFFVFTGMLHQTSNMCTYWMGGAGIGTAAVGSCCYCCGTNNASTSSSYYFRDTDFGEAFCVSTHHLVPAPKRLWGLLDLMRVQHTSLPTYGSFIFNLPCTICNICMADIFTSADNGGAPHYGQVSEGCDGCGSAFGGALGVYSTQGIGYDRIVSQGSSGFAIRVICSNCTSAITCYPCGCGCWSMPKPSTAPTGLKHLHHLEYFNCGNAFLGMDACGDMWYSAGSNGLTFSRTWCACCFNSGPPMKFHILPDKVVILTAGGAIAVSCGDGCTWSCIPWCADKMVNYDISSGFRRIGNCHFVGSAGTVYTCDFCCSGYVYAPGAFWYSKKVGKLISVIPSNVTNLTKTGQVSNVIPADMGTICGASSSNFNWDIHNAANFANCSNYRGSNSSGNHSPDFPSLINRFNYESAVFCSDPADKTNIYWKYKSIYVSCYCLAACCGGSAMFVQDTSYNPNLDKVWTLIERRCACGTTWGCGWPSLVEYNVRTNTVGSLKSLVCCCNTDTCVDLCFCGNSNFNCERASPSALTVLLPNMLPEKDGAMACTILGVRYGAGDSNQMNSSHIRIFPSNCPGNLFGAYNPNCSSMVYCEMCKVSTGYNDRTQFIGITYEGTSLLASYRACYGGFFSGHVAFMRPNRPHFVSTFYSYNYLCCCLCNSTDCNCSLALCFCSFLTMNDYNRYGIDECSALTACVDTFAGYRKIASSSYNGQVLYARTYTNDFRQNNFVATVPSEQALANPFYLRCGCPSAGSFSDCNKEILVTDPKMASTVVASISPYLARAFISSVCYTTPDISPNIPVSVIGCDVWSAMGPSKRSLSHKEFSVPTLPLGYYIKT